MEVGACTVQERTSTRGFLASASWVGLWGTELSYNQTSVKWHFPQCPLPQGVGLQGFESASVESPEGRSPWRRKREAEPVSAGGTPWSWRRVLEGAAVEIEAVNSDVV